jgi:hypothetical protein
MKTNYEDWFMGTPVKILALLFILCLVYAKVNSQTIDELKIYVDNQKATQFEKVGERWVDYKLLKEFERKSLVDTTVLIVGFMPDALNKGLVVNYQRGDTTFIPKTNRHSYRKSYQSNGTVKYQQYTELWKSIQKEKSKEEILQDWKAKSKTEKIDDVKFIAIQEYIVKGKEIVKDTVQIKPVEVIKSIKE